MSNKLILPVALQSKLNSAEQSTINSWAAIHIFNVTDLLNIMISKMNAINDKLDIGSFEFRNDVSVYGESSTYFGLIVNEEDVVFAYVFVVPPNYPTRSGVLAQQVFPVLSGIIPHLHNSHSFRISNRPIYILNLNEINHTKSMAVNFFSGELLGFHYVDLYDRDIHQILIANGLNPRLKTLANYNYILSSLQNVNANEIFLINPGNTIMFLKTRLKDGINVHNEPYWFALKAYAALYLALNEQYAIDMSEIESLNRGNKTLDAFRDYVQRFI